MGVARTSRIVLHAMWISVLAAMPALFGVSMLISAIDHDPDLGRGADGALAFVVMLAPLWIPPVALGGAIIGLAAAAANRLLVRRGVGLRMAAAAFSGGLVGLGLAVATYLLLRVSPVVQPRDCAVGFVIGVIAGGVALMLAERARGPGVVGGWAAAAGVLAAATALLSSYLALIAFPWDATESCAIRLGAPETEVTAVDSMFPPQTWCVTADRIVPWTDSWLAPVVAVLGAAALACAVVAVGRWISGRATRSVLVTTALVAVVGGGVAIAWLNPQPPADRVDQARTELRNRPAASSTGPSGPASAPPASPTVAPEVTVADARDKLDALARTATTAAGSTVLWPSGPAIAEAACTLPSGRAGRILTSTGRFTTRALADVHGPAEMAALELANEKVAERIAAGWRASGLVSGDERIHGEWWFGLPTGGPLESAHLGFTNGIGEYRVASQCARG